LWRCGDGLFFRSTSPLASDALLTTLHPLLENVMTCKPLITSKFLTSSELPFHGWKSPEITWGRDLDCMADVIMGFHRSTCLSLSAIQSTSRPMRFLGFSNHEKGASRLLLKLAANRLQHVFEKWVERCIVCQGGGGYFEKETVTAPPQSSDSE
jgi:hypothetical protein